MRRTPPPSSEEIALFRDAVGEVAPLASDRAEDTTRRPSPQPRQTEADRRAVAAEIRAMPLAELELEMSEPLSYVAPGTAPRLLRRLGSGAYSVRDEIDLHGLTLAQAETVLAQFLTRCRDSGRWCVRVVHGKGQRSLGEAPVLKALVDRMLRQRRDVLAFRTARAADGGAGAVVILLRE
jgi:DNA-nicking Smr family endonuclease